MHHLIAGVRTLARRGRRAVGALRRLPKLLPDLLIVGGAACVVTGVLVLVGIGWALIVAGALLALLGWIVS